MKFLKCLKLVLLVCFSNVLLGQIDSTKTKTFWEAGYLKGYGIVNYYNFDWDTDPDKRHAFDAERLNLYLGYHFSPFIEFKSEIEFEHGGTGSTMEFDVLEEFGEFEQEIEAGGEVILEQINILFKLHKLINVRVGKFRFYMGNASKLDDPTEYFTTHRSEVENTILPLGWYEHGIELSGNFTKNLSYKLYAVNGLDATGFSSANWIKRGYQKRFETVNSNDFAYAFRLDYKLNDLSEVGFSIYTGNTTNNRPKPDTEFDARITYGDFHLVYDQGPFRSRAFAMYGVLENSELISKLNRNLSNNLNVKRTPVGQSALGYYVEMAYDILSLTKIKDIHNLYVFGRYEYYDSMFETEGEIFNNPRWERTVYVGGINYYPHEKIVIKSQFSHRRLGTDEIENTFSAGIGFKF